MLQFKSAAELPFGVGMLGWVLVVTFCEGSGCHSGERGVRGNEGWVLVVTL